MYHTNDLATFGTIDSPTGLQKNVSNLGDDEPFDVRRTSVGTDASATTVKTDASDATMSDEVNTRDRGEDGNLYASFLSALQGRALDDTTVDDTDEASVAASYASSAPFSPERRRTNTSDGGEDASIGGGGLSSPSPTRSRLSPFSRIRVGRWRNTQGGSTSNNNAEALARDLEDDMHENDGTASSSSDNISSAINSFSKGNPPVHFMSRRARVVSVSRRHAFPPSKCPEGNLTIMSSQENNWLASYDIPSEGILPSGWLEKHARALPSALVVVTTVKESTARESGRVDPHVVQAVDDLRMTLAEKRSVPIHLVCLMKQEEGKEDPPSGSAQTMQVKEKARNKDEFSVAKERICQDCNLPQSQVFILKYPSDLEPDEWENALLRSPYLPGAPPMPGSNADSQTNNTISVSTMMNPLLRQLDRSLRDTSALYYSRLAEAQEHKLSLWRNRYHTTNASFEVNTLMAAMRCARYALKVATLRELQMRTGGHSSYADAAGTMSASAGGSGGKWTDKGSLAMRHYEEAYRWVIELQRRSIAWRIASLSGVGNAGQTPMTPGSTPLPADGNELRSPHITESPGGGIGVEMSLPPFAAATPPPPPIHKSPGLTSKRSSNTVQNIAFYSHLWEQCRSIGSLVNVKLLRSASTSSSTDAELQWRRHRVAFLSTPQGIPLFDPRQDDEFFGPLWHRIAYATEELLTMACIAEGRWHKALIQSVNVPLSPLYHQAAAPWKIYSELAETTLSLGEQIQKTMKRGASKDPDASNDEGNGRRRFVGSIASGNGVGTMQWYYANEAKRDHRAIALDYVLHALELLKENDSHCHSMQAKNEIPMPPTSDSQKSTIRMHYLAGKLLIGLGNPLEALPHLQIAATNTKKWPSMHLSIQRALFVCEEQCIAKGEDLASTLRQKARAKDACIELLLKPDSCSLLSEGEIRQSQTYAWSADHSDAATSFSREIVWTDDDSGVAKPPFEFAVTFLESTHATSSDSVLVCVSVKSCLNFPVFVDSVQLNTTAGCFPISNLEHCADKSLMQSWLKSQNESKNDGFQSSTNKGIQFQSKDLSFFFSEIKVPSDLAEIALGKAAVDLSKFFPKNAKLCNMGLVYAGMMVKALALY